MTIVTQIKMSGSPIWSIEVKCPLSEDRENDRLTVYLRPQDDGLSERATKAIKAIAKIASAAGASVVHGTSNFLVRDESNSFRNFLILNKAVLLEPISNKLCDKNLIEYSDRLNLEEAIKSVEQVFRDMPYIKFGTMTKGQSKFLKELAFPYIEELVDSSQSYRDIIPTIVHAMTKPKMWYFWQMWNTRQPDDPTYWQNSKNNCACMSDLSRLFNGDPALSSTYQRLGKIFLNSAGEPDVNFIGRSIPSLVEQRIALIEKIKKTFDDKYGIQRENEFEAFYLELALEKLALGTLPKKQLSPTYQIGKTSGFPQKKNSDKTLGANIPPDSNEERILKKYGFKRFPVSPKDLDAAKLANESALIKPRDESCGCARDRGNSSFSDSSFSTMMSDRMNEMNSLFDSMKVLNLSVGRVASYDVHTPNAIWNHFRQNDEVPELEDID